MTKYNYISIDYFSYNIPDYYAAIVTLILFMIFFTILYTILKYEKNNRQDICDPMFYYGKSCGNVMSKQLLMNPKFLEGKKSYYESVAKFNEEKKQYDGVRYRTAQNKNQIDNAEEDINNNLNSNTEFGEINIDEIQKLTTITQLVASKYLGNMKSFFENAPSEIIDGVHDLPQRLGELKQQIQSSIVNPVLSSYTAPLQKLYKSLMVIDKTNRH